MDQWISRRRFLQHGLGAGVALTQPWRTRVASAAARGELKKYLEPLPVPGAGIVVATPNGSNRYSFTQTEISRQLHPQLPPTPLWAYDDGSGLSGQAGSFGMAVVAHSGTPLTVDFTHQLPFTYPDWIPVDMRETPLGNQVRLMTHLHGGFVAGDSDGNPAVSPNGFGLGETQTVFYTNQKPQMPASLLWFHDHGLGTTRLNVFAGLAGAYILRDEFDSGAEDNPIGIPGGPYEIPLVVQDRQFNSDGTMLYPRSDIPGAVWIGEYFGDVMLVNGKVWPFLDVEPRLYRFRILNGCNSRILNLDHRRGEHVADRRRRWNVGRARSGETGGAGPGRACGRARRLQPTRGGEVAGEEPPSTEASLDACSAANGRHADSRRQDSQQSGADRHSDMSAGTCGRHPCQSGRHDALHHSQRNRRGHGQLGPASQCR